MDKVTANEILNEAIRIGDNLLAEAETDKNGISWKTMSSTSEHVIEWVKSNSLYTGISGISLFLLELYRSTGESKYLIASEESMRWVENLWEKKPSQYFAFITGNMGVSYAMLRMFEVTGKKKYLINALKIAKKCPAPLIGGADDFINGTAGIILALLHLHSASGEKWLLDKIDKNIKHLLNKVNAGKKGLYWDRVPGYITGLCGFSHGAAGIGYVFLELGHYFNNPSFYWIAEQAFLYESTHFNKKMGNWPDLRKFRDSDSDFQIQKKAFIEGNISVFTTRGDMNAWCHGAAGLGLSRIRACELLKNWLYERELKIALKKTIETDVNGKYNPFSFIYCHGKGGNAELFLESYKYFKNIKYLKYAEIIALEALRNKKEKKIYNSGFGYKEVSGKEDKSLFMGISGIGYFYLKLLNPLNIPSVLFPKIESLCKVDISPKDYPYIKISLEEIKKKVVSKIFKRTLTISEIVMKSETKKHFAALRLNRIDEINNFVKFIKNKSVGLKPIEKKVISDALSLELTKLKKDRTIISNSYLDIKSIMFSKRAEELCKLDDKKFANIELSVDPDVKLRFTKWDWNSNSNGSWGKNLKEHPSQFVTLLKPEAKGISESSVSPIVHNILASFESKRCVKDVIEDILSGFDGINDVNKKEIISAVQDQIKQLIDYNILIEK